MTNEARLRDRKVANPIVAYALTEYDVRRVVAGVWLITLGACGGEDTTAESGPDASMADAELDLRAHPGESDVGGLDIGPPDPGGSDMGPTDTGGVDGTVADAAVDVATADVEMDTGSSTDASGDAGTGDADGAGAFVATLLRAASNNDFYFGGTVSPYVWVLRHDYVECDFAAAIDVAPGAGNRWTFTAEFATLGANQNCTDVATWTTAALCTIDGVDKSCAAAAVPMAIRGPACLRGHARIAPGNNVGMYPGQGAGGTVSFHCRDASGDGAVQFQGTGQANVTGAAFFGGQVVRSPNMDRAFWIHTGEPLESCSGVVAMPSTPTSGETWHIQMATSNTALTADQNCLALTYTTTPDLCTISGSMKSCHWAPASAYVPAGGCLQLRATCTGGACSPGTVSPNYGLDCSSSTSAPFAGGGPTYQSAGSGAFDAGHEFGPGPWGISDANRAARSFGQQQWISPPVGLARCGGAFTFQNAITGSGSYDIGMWVSIASLAPGEGCLDLTYAPSPTFCRIAVGQRSCFFPLTEMGAVPPNGCFALDVRTSGGTPVAGASNNFNWQMSCATD